MLEGAVDTRGPDRRPVLLYSAGCGPCRRLSVLAVGLAAGLVRRCEVSSPEAAELLADRPDLLGKLVLIAEAGTSGRRREPAVGWGVFPALPRAVVRSLRAAVRPGPALSRRTEGK